MIVKILGGLGLLVGLILTPAVIVAAFGRGLLYRPTLTTDSELNRLVFRDGWQRAQLQVPEKDGSQKTIKLQGLIRPPAKKSLPWLVFFGGNAMSITSGQSILDYVDAGSGYGLAIFAYRGYDTSEGKPTQNALQGDALAVLRYLEVEWGATINKIVPIGQSLGSGVATHLCATLDDAKTPVGGLILLSPYTSMRTVFQAQVPKLPIGFALADSFESIKLAPKVSVPVLLIHGEDDTLIPISHAEALAEAFPGTTKLLRLPNQGHNGLWQPPETAVEVRGFLRDIFKE